MNHEKIIIQEKDIDPSAKSGERQNYTMRHAARAVLLDDQNQVALMHSRTRNYYKLPGGGVEKDEDSETALQREVLEETGYLLSYFKPIGTVTEWRDTAKMKQVSEVYLAQPGSNDAQPSLDEHEAEDGFELVWAQDVQHAIALVGEAINSEDIYVAYVTKRDVAILDMALHHLNIR